MRPSRRPAPTPRGATLPGGVPARDFLKKYWQKRPRLLRHAFPGFRTFISRDELFRLACRDNVESRLVLERGGDYPWQLVHGPFRPRDFRALPRSGWTLLVQNVDLHLREGAALLRQFRFIPEWRIDDLMVSYAPPGGSVGAHLDSYDVFLLQALGRRRWLLNTRDYGEDDFIPGLDLRIIGGFRPRREWRLDPGDMLYLPPGVAHHGIAETECMTYSIGFRAPAGRELALHHIEENAPEGPRYADPDLRLRSHSAEIASGSLSRIRALVRGTVADDRALNRWFGRHITRLPEGIAPEAPRRPLAPRAFLTLWRDRGRLYRAHPSRAAFLREKDAVVLFVNGDTFDLPNSARGLVQNYTGKWRLDFPKPQPGVHPSVLAALCKMYNHGLIATAEPCNGGSEPGQKT